MPNPIPVFDHNLVLPPHMGDPVNRAQLSPYPCTTLDLCQRLGTSPERRAILAKFQDFRDRLRSEGLTNGFQPSWRTLKRGTAGLRTTLMWSRFTGDTTIRSTPFLSGDFRRWRTQRCPRQTSRSTIILSMPVSIPNSLWIKPATGFSFSPTTGWECGRAC